MKNRSFDLINHPLKLLIAVVGPTASGKSELALNIAEHFGGEIVNFDSIQLYRGFDIGAAKTPLAQRRNIPHHLLDIFEPNEQVSAGLYVRHARKTLEEIATRGQLPILVGGTGFYLRALIEGLPPTPTRDQELRDRLNRRIATRPAGYLHQLLNRLDAKAADYIHPNDHAKLTRAIEVCIIGKKPASKLWETGENALTNYEVFRIGLNPPRRDLREKIELRTQRMFNNGLVEEVQQLLDTGLRREAWPLGAIGYKQALAHLNGASTVEQAIRTTITQTHRYAKRQMTWFRREQNVFWIESFGDNPETHKRAYAAVKQQISVQLQGR